MTWARTPPRSKDYTGAWSPDKDMGRATAAASGLVRAALAPARPIPKAERHESTPWRRAVASLDCVLCGKSGETQCAHRNEGKGMGLKTDDAWTAALCTGCHREIDQGATLTREDRRDRMDRAVLLTVRELARLGFLGILKGRP